MRQLAETRVNPVVIVGIREGLTALGGLLIFLPLLWRKKTPLPPLKLFLCFLLAAFGVQFVANLLQQRSFEVVGMGLTTASCWSGQILWTPIFGWFLLREKLSVRLALSLFLAFVALIFLTAGAETQKTPAESTGAAAAEVRVPDEVRPELADAAAAEVRIPDEVRPELADAAAAEVRVPDEVRPEIADAAAAEVRIPDEVRPELADAAGSGILPGLAIQFVLLAAFGGAICATSNCIIRWINRSGVTPFFAVMFLPGVGAVGLLGTDFLMNGFQSWQQLSQADLWYAFWAGVTNMLAFISLTVGLRYLSAVRVCVITVSQLALAPVVGCLTFCEPMNGFLMTGILLVITGILVSAAEPQKKSETV